MRDFESRAIEVARLVKEKQIAYGDSFGKAGKILAILYPDGVTVEQYAQMLTIVRIIDKLSRIATSAPGDKENPFEDIAGYALLEITPGADELPIIPDFPVIAAPLDKRKQIEKIAEESREWFAETDPEKAAIEFQDFLHAVITYQRAHFTHDEILAARKAVISKNTARGYYQNKEA